MMILQDYVASGSEVVSSIFGMDRYGKLTCVARAAITAPAWDDGVYSGAVYDHLGVLSLASVRHSHIIPYRPCDPLTIDRATFRPSVFWPEAIYAGHYFFSWGHFLSETLSTAHLSSALPRVPVVLMPFFLVKHSEWRSSFQLHAEPLLTAAWEEREIVILSEPTEVQRLWMPPRSLSFGFEKNLVAPEIDAVFDRIATTFGGRPEGKILLVRRPSDHRHAHPHEESIYRAISQLPGLEDVEPWRHTAAEQVRIMSRAKCLVGFGGSHLHNSVFMPAGGTVIELNSPAWQYFNSIQGGLNVVRKHHTVNIETFDEERTFEPARVANLVGQALAGVSGSANAPRS